MSASKSPVVILLVLGSIGCLGVVLVATVVGAGVVWWAIESKEPAVVAYDPYGDPYSGDPYAGDPYADPFAGNPYVGAPLGAEPALPSVTRNVPNHPTSLLQGCTSTDREFILLRLDLAIALGAPTYNDGNFYQCYAIYEEAARDIEGDLSSSCEGPARALAEGRRIATTRSSDSGKAWAMRDAFDGLIDVLTR